MLDYGAFEAAVAAWLVTGTGLPASSVIDRNAKVPQPAMPYAEFVVPMALPRGRDERRQSYDSTAAAGQEVVTTTRGDREFTVSVDIRTKAATGSGTARSYAEGAVNALGLRGVTDKLKAAGLAMIEVASVVDLSDRSGPMGAGRVKLDVRFRCVDSASEATGYIETIALPPADSTFLT